MRYTHRAPGELPQSPGTQLKGCEGAYLDLSATPVLSKELLSATKRVQRCSSECMSCVSVPRFALLILGSRGGLTSGPQGEMR